MYHQQSNPITSSATEIFEMERTYCLTLNTEAQDLAVIAYPDFITY